MKNQKHNFEILKYYNAKSKNKRINIFLSERNENKSHFLIIQTKRLADFKKREIISTELHYSIETIKIISELLNHFFSNSEIENKILLKELNDMKEIFNVTTNVSNSF